MNAVLYFVGRWLVRRRPKPPPNMQVKGPSLVQRTSSEVTP